MTQHPRIEIAPAAMGIEQRAVGRLGNGIDGQIAARQIFLERDLRPEFDRKSAIAGRHLALEPRQGMLLVSVGMQKHRKVPADFPIFQAQQLLSGAADDDPIAFLDGQAEQGVPNGSANQIHLHA